MSDFNPVYMAGIAFGVALGITLTAILVVKMLGGQQAVAPRASQTGGQGGSRRSLVFNWGLGIFFLILLFLAYWFWSEIGGLPDKMEYDMELIEWIPGIGLILFSVVGIIYALQYRKGWAFVCVGIVWFLVWFVGLDTIETWRSELQKQETASASGSTAPTGCTTVSTVPRGRKGDFCIDVSKGDTVTVRPPPRTYVEVLPDEPVKVRFTSWKQNNTLQPIEVDPSMDTWPCFPSGWKTATVTAETDTILRVRVGIGKTLATRHNCS